MKKKHLILPVLSTVLLAPAFLDHQVAADEVQPATAVANVNEPAQKPVETDLAQAGGVSADEASVNAAIAANAQDVSGASVVSSKKKVLSEMPNLQRLSRKNVRKILKRWS